MKAESSFEPHLVVNEISLPPSTEWVPKFRGWSFIQVRSGISYWQQPTGTLEISPGSALVLTKEFRGGLRASQLSEVVIAYFCMEPENLTGLMSLSEQNLLKKAAAREQLSVRILPPDDVIAERFRNIGPAQNGNHLSTRVQLLQLFIDLFQCELDEEADQAVPAMDGRARLRQFLKQTAAAEFLNLSLAELAPKMHCSPRHLSRLFREELGTSFRDKQTEMRLAKACQLLATSNAKVIDVALTSGYQSNSLFSLMFKKHFGVSPGKWRQRHGKRAPQRQKFLRMLPA